MHYLHVNTKWVAELEQGLIWLLAIKAWQYCSQVQQWRIKGCFQQETGRRAGDQWTLVVVSNFDGNGLLILSSVAGACWCERHLQPQSQLKSSLSSAGGVLSGVWHLVRPSMDMSADTASTSVSRCKETACIW